MDIDQIKKDFAEYGYGLTDDLLIKYLDNSGIVSHLKIQDKKGRIQVRHIETKQLLWSGQDPVNFIKSFWFAEKVNKE